MTTFSWKRKAGEKLSKSVSPEFSVESDNDVLSGHINWLNSFKKKKTSSQNNCEIKIEQHKNEGIRLAELHRFWEAVDEWDKALTLAPSDHKILEMKAQALLQLAAPFKAVQAAEKAVKCNPRWWVAYQTLGRSQLGIGDIKMAKISFAKAVHIHPIDRELWEDDLGWSLKLLEQQKQQEAEVKKETTSMPEVSCNQTNP